MKKIVAQDGLRARDSGPWGQTKLAFLDHFCPSAIQATATKHHRFYIDLFAGPGVNVIRDSGGTEYQGSPLRVLEYAGRQRQDLSFTNAVFINQRKSDHEALKTRVDRACASGLSRIPLSRIDIRNENANDALPHVLAGIPQRAYVMVFADMEAPYQWPWESMQALRGVGHESIDLYALFPLDMALSRLVAYRRENQDRWASALTRFYGTQEWRTVAARRATIAQSPQLRRELVQLYLDQLRTLWKHAGEIVDVYYRGRQRLYKMLFASDHDAGKRIAEWIKKHPDEVQGNLFSSG